MRKDSSDYPNWEDNQQKLIFQESPLQRYLSRRTLLMGGLGGVAIASLLATVVGVKLFSQPLFQHPWSHPSLTIPSSAIEKLAWSPDGKRIAVGYANGVRVLDRQSGHQLWDYTLAPLNKTFIDPDPLELTWSLDGSRLYYVNDILHVFDAESGKHLWMDTVLFHYPGAIVTGFYPTLAWSPDRSHYAIGPTSIPSLEEPVVFIWDITARKITAICFLPVAISDLRALELAWSPDGSQLASIDDIGSIHVWPASGGPPTWSGSYPTQDFPAATVRPWIGWSHTGDALGTGYFLGEYTFWQASSGKQLFQKKPDMGQYSQDGGQSGISRSPDGTRLTFGVPQDQDHLLLQVWDIQRNQLLFTCQGGALSNVTDVAWSPDGKYVAACCTIGQNVTNPGVQIWDASNGRALTFYYIQIMPLYLFWSPDSRFLAISTIISQQCNYLGYRGGCTATNYAYQVFHPPF